MATRLSLLPLHRTVMPGSSLVIPLYDDVAAALVAELGGDRFGTVLIRPEDVSGPRLHDVGTELRILGRRAVGGDVPMVHAVGERRFSVTEWVEIDQARYVVAEVDFVDEADRFDLGPRRDEVAKAFRRYLAVLAESGRSGAVYVEVADDPEAASYQVASAMRLSSPERQELLELGAADRLDRELMVLTREIELLERMME